jgi:hypothetical protein
MLTGKLQRQCGDVRIVRRLATVLLVLAYGWWAVSLPPFSASATVAVVVPGGAAMVLGGFWRRPERRDGTGSIGLWVTVAAAASCWQLAAYVQHPRIDHPTLSSLTNALLDSHLSRAAAFAVWLLAAMGLARR